MVRAWFFIFIYLFIYSIFVFSFKGRRNTKFSTFDFHNKIVIIIIIIIINCIECFQTGYVFTNWSWNLSYDTKLFSHLDGTFKLLVTVLIFTLIVARTLLLYYTIFCNKYYVESINRNCECTQITLFIKRFDFFLDTVTFSNIHTSREIVCGLVGFNFAVVITIV